MAGLLSLAVVSFWVSATVVLGDNGVLQVPGLKVGASILFGYGGNNFSRVILSVEDGPNSRALQFALRHNERCRGDPSYLLFTTKTNGRWDTSKREIVQFAELQNGNDYYWNITIQEHSFLIGYYENEELRMEHEFDYRAQHPISDIKKIKLYAHPGCGVESTNFQPYLALRQGVQTFSKVTIRARRPGIFGNVINIQKRLYENIGATIAYPDRVLLYSSDSSETSMNLNTDFTPETYIEFTVQHIDGDQYELTSSVDDQVIQSPTTINVGKINFLIGFMEIEKLEIE